MRTILSALAIVAVLGSAAVAGPQKNDKKATKVVDLWVCPMTGEAVTKGHEAGKPVVVAGKRVHFCCAGCPDAFAKLSPADQKTKVAEAAKKAKPAKS
jgi:hypothetical protein